MKKSIDFDKVADIYDLHDIKYDIPFFLKETEGFKGDILELMCGTGRISIPLLNSGKRMTCVDYSKKMLDSFKRKIKDQKYNVDIVQMDIVNLNLGKKFGLILIPSHSFSEILTLELQTKALKSISLHLDKRGMFLLTLHNPKIRLKSADGILREDGIYPMDLGFEIIDKYGDYSYGRFDEETSNYMIYKMIKK